jgi:hypothetical protein
MKWNEKTVFQKCISVVSIICSLTAIVFAVFSLAGIWKNAIDYALLMQAVCVLCFGIQNWKKQKAWAIFQLATAALVCISQTYILIIR